MHWQLQIRLSIIYTCILFPEVSEQTNGKACILGEAIRMVKDTLEQIECRKKDNAALLSESQYVRLLMIYRCFSYA